MCVFVSKRVMTHLLPNIFWQLIWCWSVFHLSFSSWISVIVCHKFALSWQNMHFFVMMHTHTHNHTQTHFGTLIFLLFRLCLTSCALGTGTQANVIEISFLLLSLGSSHKFNGNFQFPDTKPNQSTTHNAWQYCCE